MLLFPVVWSHPLTLAFVFLATTAPSWPRGWCHNGGGASSRLVPDTLLGSSLTFPNAQSTNTNNTDPGPGQSYRWVHGHPDTPLRPLNPPHVRPIVLWHGMGDTATSEGMTLVRTTLMRHIPGVYVHSVQVGDSASADRKHSYLDDIRRQITTVCHELRSIPQLQHGFHAIGFSQGGLFLRAIAQMCPQVKMVRLITWASPHQGIADIPPTWCTHQPIWCGIARWALHHGVYTSGVQHRIVQASYVKTPWDLDAYRHGNLLLPDLNNELDHGNPSYIHQIQALEKVVLVRHVNDTVLSPSETAWFWEMVNPTVLVPVWNTTLYQQDRIGLRQVDRRGDMVLLEVPGDHMQFSIHQFISVTLPFLAPKPHTPSPRGRAPTRRPAVVVVPAHVLGEDDEVGFVLQSS